MAVVDKITTSLISATQGARTLTNVSSVSFDDGDTRNDKKNCTGKIFASTRSRGSGSLSLECFQTSDADRVRWDKLKRADEKFTIVVDHGNGSRTRYTSCLVENVSKKNGSDGDHDFTVSIKVLDEPIES